jgi:hypothetical protein
LAHELIPRGVVHAASLPNAVHTLQHPRLSHAAARGFFVGEAAKLPAMLDAEAVRLGAENSLYRAYAAHFEGAIPDAVRTTFTREVCRLQAKRCATVLAEWAHDAPGSPALQAVVEWAREKEVLRDELQDDRLAFIAELFDAENFDDAPGTYASARRFTKAFAEHYDHSAPFDLQVLSDAWWRCTGDDRCASVGAPYRSLGASRSAAATPQP